MVWSGSIEEEEAELGEGRVIDGRYRIRSLLGEGGMGCVYLADDIQQGGEVALKILIPRYRGRPEREQRLLNEAILARKVGEHPRLARLLGSGRLADLDGCPFVTWEVVHGRSLNALLAVRAKLPPRMAAEWARQLADAVQAMHRAGVVHRDVTVTNIFIEGPDGDARVKLIDLSHSSVIPTPGVPNRRLTRELEVPGAHRYMSPEQARALPPNPKMDVFSFGVVLHEMLTGSNPFFHVPDRDSYIALQREGELEVARIDRRAYPGVPVAMIELVEACTRNDVAERVDMDEVVWRLDDAISMMTAPLAFPGVKLVPQEPRSVVVVQADVVEPEVEVEVEIVEHGSRRSLVIIIVVALAVVLVVALLAMVWVRSRDDAGSQTSEAESPREEPRLDESAVPTEVPEVAPIPPRESVEVELPPRKPKRRSRPKQKREAAEPSVIPAETERCLDAVATARQANGAHAWERVLTHTDDPACFGSRTAWLKLRVRALSEVGRYRECISLGDGSGNASVGRFVEVCRLKKASQ